MKAHPDDRDTRSPVAWRSRPARATLAPGEVQIWRVPLDEPAAPATAMLSDDERARAARFHFEHSRRRFIAGRIAVREILALYLTDGRAPGQLRFAAGAHGRPSLLDAEALHFNFSRSDGLGLCAVGATALLGVDLELIRPIPEAAAITRSHFSPRERALLASLNAAPDSPEFQRAFYATWTRKEAFIKALGLGLAQPLDSFSVMMLPGQPPRLLEVPEGRATDWTLRAFTPAPGYEGALAIRAERVSLSFWAWTSQGAP